MAKPRIETRSHGVGPKAFSWRVILYECYLCGLEMEQDYHSADEEDSYAIPDYYETKNCEDCANIQRSLPLLYKLIERINENRFNKMNERIQLLEVEIYGKAHPKDAGIAQTPPEGALTTVEAG